MQYKVLSFKIEIDNVSTGFFSSRKITEEDKLAAMEEKINELAKEGWRVNQMSTNTRLEGGHGMYGGGVIEEGYTVVVIMEKE